MGWAEFKEVDTTYQDRDEAGTRSPGAMGPQLVSCDTAELDQDTE